ncbi:MAG: hypothetical protein AB1500_04375 [Bacillota bacterium]
MQRVVALFLAVVLSALAAGCWDVVEIEDQAYVTGMSVDIASGNKIKLTAQVVNPRVIGGGARGITPAASISAK